jgi:uncharacterized NAD(P)/FAD-binding protein YdhS
MFLMKKIAVIGAGFSGTMLSVQLIKKAVAPLEIFLINEADNFNKGFAYNTYSDKHLLNVIASKMSAFPDSPDDFLNWVISKEPYKDKDKALIANSFLSRKLYGEYLENIFSESKIIASEKKLKINTIKQKVNDLKLNVMQKPCLLLDNNEVLEVDNCVIATGNQMPGNPSIKNSNFFSSSNYFQNPWDESAVKNLRNDLPIMILGNGLTMVDTVLGLLEKGFKGRIFSLSPNGFNIFPHRFNHFNYEKIAEELNFEQSLYDLVKLINKHIKILKKFGLSAEPVIDSLRPFTQRIWQSLSEEDKKVFLKRLRHLWGVARHRIPLETYEKIQDLKNVGALSILSGKVTDINEYENFIEVEFFDKKEKYSKCIVVSRVINCTGPETNIISLENNFLKKCLEHNLLFQDCLKLGIRTNVDNFKILKPVGGYHNNLFTIGSSLKGELWESTAVNEIRVQAESLAGILISD